MNMNIKKRLRVTCIVLCAFYSLTATQAQADCKASTQASTPSIDFAVYGDGTVMHKTTGLMWKVCSEGQVWDSSDDSCTGAVTEHTWKSALQIPQNLNPSGGFAGKTDWRLPNRKELQSIVEYKCFNPSINEDIFKNVITARYWSSSPSAYDISHAWVVNFYYGGGNYGDSRYNGSHVRLVRSGQ